MPRVSTFCPRCGETIETEVPEEARLSGRAELTCPACRFAFVIEPARRGQAMVPVARSSDAPRPGAAPPRDPVRATGATVVPSPVPSGRAAPSFKPTAAAMMLFFAALVGLYLGSLLTFQDDIVHSAFEEMEGNGNFTGRVRGADGAPMGNVSVTLYDGPAGTVSEASTPFANTTTAPDGRYRFADVPLGIYTVRLVHADYVTVWLEAPAYPPEYESFFGDGTVFGAVEMRLGSPSETRHLSVVDDMTTYVRVWGGVILVGAILAVAGGVAALRRRGYPWAIAGAIGAILSWGFFLNLVLGAVALVLIIIARREFRARRPAGPTF